MTTVKGEGTIVQLEKDKPKGKCRKWQLRVCTGRDPRTGKYKTKTRRIEGTLTEAKAELRSFIEEVEGNRVQTKTGTTFEEYCAHYLALRKAKKEVAATTLEKQEFQFHAASHHIGHMKLEEITPAVLDEMYAAMMQGDTLSGRPSGGSYVNQIHDNITLVFEHAINEGVLVYNPCAKANPPKMDTKEKKAVPPAKVQELIDTFDATNTHECAYLLAITMGLRRGEICGLSWGDIDFERNMVDVTHSYDNLGNLKGTKTKAGTRILPLHPVAREGLLQIKEAQKVAFEKNNLSRYQHKAGRGEKEKLVQGPETPVITGKYGQRVLPTSMSRWWSIDRKEYGLPGYTLHELRHTYLTMLAMSGVHPKVMQELAGHYSSQITMDIYTHVSMEAKRAAVEAVSGLFGKTQEQFVPNSYQKANQE